MVHLAGIEETSTSLGLVYVSSRVFDVWSVSLV